MGKGKKGDGKNGKGKGAVGKGGNGSRKIVPLRISVPKPKTSKASGTKKASKKERTLDSANRSAKRSQCGEVTETEASDTSAFIDHRVKMTCTCPHLLSHPDRLALLDSMALVRSKVNGELIIRQRGTTGAFGSIDGEGMGGWGSQNLRLFAQLVDEIRINAGDKKRAADQSHKGAWCQECEEHNLEEADDVLTCLHCGFTGCSKHKHLFRHCLSSLGEVHSFATNRSRAEVFCALCCDYVYDVEFDAVVACTDDRQAIPEVGGADSAARKRRCLAREMGHYVVADQWGQQPWRDDSWPPRPLLSPRRQRMVGAGIRGMFNLGNTCFMSSVLQAMLHTSVVQSFFLGKGHERARCKKLREEIPRLARQIQLLAPSSPGEELVASTTGDFSGSSGTGGVDRKEDPSTNKLKDYCIACELSKLFEDMFSTESVDATLEKVEPYVPNRLLEAVWGSSEALAGYEQQDAHEFLIAILDTLHGHLMQAAVNEHRVQPLRQRLAYLKQQAKGQGAVGGVADVSVGVVGDKGSGNARAGTSSAPGAPKSLGGSGKQVKKSSRKAVEEKKPHTTAVGVGPLVFGGGNELNAGVAFAGGDVPMSPTKLHGERLTVNPSSKRPVLSPLSPLGIGSPDPVAQMHQIWAGEVSPESMATPSSPSRTIGTPETGAGGALGEAEAGGGDVWGAGAGSAHLTSMDTLNGQRLEDLSLAGFVPEVFAGATRSDVVCTGCGELSCTYERFLEVSLPIRPSEEDNDESLQPMDEKCDGNNKAKDKVGMMAGQGGAGGTTSAVSDESAGREIKSGGGEKTSLQEGMRVETGAGGHGKLLDRDGGIPAAGGTITGGEVPGVLVQPLGKGGISDCCVEQVDEKEASQGRGDPISTKSHIGCGEATRQKEDSGRTSSCTTDSSTISSKGLVGVSMGGSGMASEVGSTTATHSSEVTTSSVYCKGDSGVKLTEGAAGEPTVGGDSGKGDVRGESRSSKGENKSGGQSSVTECFARFTAREDLGARMSCDACAAPMAKTKQMSFCSLPRVLVLHLKRFDALADKKIEDFVRFPARDLDMGRYLTGWSDGVPNANNPLTKGGEGKEGGGGAPPPFLPYDLFAVVNHTGTMSQGHYTAFVREVGRWFRFDDTWVTEVDEEEVLGSKAYILFYMRRGADVSWRLTASGVSQLPS